MTAGAASTGRDAPAHEAGRPPVDPRAHYEARLAVLRASGAALDTRARRVGRARLGVALLALADIGGFVWARAVWSLPALVVLAVVFGALVIVHARLAERIERALAATRFFERGLARMAFRWDALASGGERFRSPDHPFSTDLDVFGRASLMQMVDATETRFGEERLAAILNSAAPMDWPTELVERAQAVRELSSRRSFCEQLATVTGVLAGEKPDPTALVRWAEGSEGSWVARSVWIAWAVPTAAGGIFVAGGFGWVSGRTMTATAVIAIGIGLAVASRLSPMLAAISSRQSGSTRWRETMQTIERERFDAPRLARLRDRLAAGSPSASDSMAGLERIVGFLDARQNEAFRFVVGPLLMWDVHCAAALVRWRARAGKALRGWFEALAEVEALASLAAFAFEHPEFAWPEPAAEPMLEARDLGHPRIASDRRVGNDVHLAGPGRALVVTGSNMSGKSTLLRAIGINVVLACAGAPVCARSMRLGPVRLATSMRLEDSLDQGVSFFYAELRRLKQILDWAREARERGEAVLFLLDEILRGTNSRERVIGAGAVLRGLLSQGALGAISTHDLGIARLHDAEASDALRGRIENVHFEEQVAGARMSFDYVLRPGIVHSSNALRLMRALGIAVPDE